MKIINSILKRYATERLIKMLNKIVKKPKTSVSLTTPIANKAAPKILKEDHIQYLIIKGIE